MEARNIDSKRILAGLLAAGLMLPLSAIAENVYRWTDENGKVHYGRTLPPEFAHKPHEILNDAGVVIERIEDPLEKLRPPKKAETKPDEPEELEPLFTPHEVRLRSDNLLMLRYHSEQDLIDAMENEVAQLGYDARLINQSRSSAMSSLSGQVKNAADRQRAGMSDDAELAKNIQSLRLRLRKSDQSLDDLKTREYVIRARFEKDLERYRFISSGGRPGTPLDEDVDAGT